MQSCPCYESYFANLVMTLAMMVMMICSTIISQTSLTLRAKYLEESKVVAVLFDGLVVHSVGFGFQ